jgi:hypothetical protein
MATTIRARRRDNQQITNREGTCPWCRCKVAANWQTMLVGETRNPAGIKTHAVFVDRFDCPTAECGQFWLTLVVEGITHLLSHGGGQEEAYSEVFQQAIFPSTGDRPAAPKEVPETIAREYEAACRTLPASPEASAALSRRCLQNTLSDQGYTQNDLVKQIDAIVAANVLPSGLAQDLHALREVGNFAAHPRKSQNTGEIFPVEPAEADWSLDLLGQLFDSLYIEPAKRQARRDQLNQKLVDAGKKPLP